MSQNNVVLLTLGNYHEKYDVINDDVRTLPKAIGQTKIINQSINQSMNLYSAEAQCF